MATPPERPAVREPATPVAYEEPERETLVSIFGGTTRAGTWTPPEVLRAVATFANVTLDFCRADIPSGVTEVEAWAVFGNVEIRVPPTLEFEVSGVAVLGNLEHSSARQGVVKRKLRRFLGRPEHETDGPPSADADAFLSVRGTAIFGNVRVVVVE